jgi:hypothetical protein
MSRCLLSYVARKEEVLCVKLTLVLTAFNSCPQGKPTFPLHKAVLPVIVLIIKDLTSLVGTGI